MQRLHKEDLAGYLMRSGEWSVLKITALADKDYIYNLKNFSFIFQKGKVINQSHCSENQLNKVKRRSRRGSIFSSISTRS